MEASTVYQTCCQTEYRLQSKFARTGLCTGPDKPLHVKHGNNSTLNLYTPSDVFFVFSFKVFTSADVARLVRESLDVNGDVPVEKIGRDVVGFIGVHVGGYGHQVGR